MKTSGILKLALVLFLFVFAGCEKNSVEQELLMGSETSFEANHIYLSNDGQYKLVITEISDSRCPMDANCVWSGEIVIKGEWTADGLKSTFEVHSILSEQNKQPEGYKIQIINAKPYPEVGVERKLEDMTVTLRVTKN
jgi:hypothetical protein